MHDWHASVNVGWNPESGEDPPYSYGEIAQNIADAEPTFQKLIDVIAQSTYAHLLDPLKNVAEPDIFPEVTHPIDEDMVVIDPSVQKETGLYPLAALWQSGWSSALPYMCVRQQVHEQLGRAVNILREFNSELSLCITDGWRSHAQQQELFDSFYVDGYVQGDPVYVSEPSDKDRFAAPHPAGGAVDVLIGVNDQAFWIGSPLDWMDGQAHTDSFENSNHDLFFIRDIRRVFTNLLCYVGFVSLDAEWWHVEYGTRRWAGKLEREPLYGNAVVDKSIYATISPVTAIVGSRRAAMQTLSAEE